MAINRISGNILQDDLRRGANLAIQGNLIYFDVTNNRVGVLNQSPTDEFEVTGVSAADNVRVLSATANGIFYASVNQLALTSANLTYDGTDFAVIGNASVSNINVTAGVFAATGYFTGNVDVVGNVNAANAVIYGNSGIFFGDSVTGNNAAFAGVPGFTQLGSNVVMQFAGNVNSYSQLNFENINSGTLASTDIILTADNGDDISYYVDLGIGSSTHLDPDFFGDTGSNNDAYLYVTASDQAGPSSTAGPGNLILGSTNGIVKIFVGNTAQANVIASVDSQGITVTGNVDANSATFGNITITGDIDIGNITVSNTTISTSLTPGNITLQPTGNATVIIDTVTGLTLPVGNIAQRPSPAATGTVRYNSEFNRLEIYDGTEWDSVVSGVTNQIITPDGSNVIYTLDRDSTSAATLVSINGVVQLPTVAYTVTGNTITFAEAPLTTDIIDIRFL